jgi:ATP-binding protein involved in chromosome partitioning
MRPVQPDVKPVVPSAKGDEESMGSPFGGPPGVPLAEWPFGESTRIISIASGKGGVGKSSITANLAAELARRGYDVCVIDADVYGFSIPKILGISEEPRVENEKIVPPEAFGVKVVSMGFFVPEDRAVIWRGPMLHKALQQFVTDVEWGRPDFVLIDMPPGTGDVAISISQFLPTSSVALVTTPQEAAGRVAQRMASMAEKVGLRLLGVIENMSYFQADDGKIYEIFGSGGGEELARRLGVPFLGKVPIDIALRTGADSGKPVVVHAPESPASLALRGIAEKLESAPASPRPRPEDRFGSFEAKPVGGSGSDTGSGRFRQEGSGAGPGAAHRPPPSPVLRVTPKRRQPDGTS